jgi:hypothetical protein
MFFAPSDLRSENAIKSKGSTKVVDDLQRGQWLNKKFLTTLRKTKSPRLAGLNIRQSGFRVLKEGNQYPVQVIWNFHEAGIGFTIVEAKYVRKNDSYELLTSSPSEQSNNKKERDIVYHPASDEISWQFTDHDGKQYDLSFVRVQPDIDRYINKTLLAGEYVDNNGQIFIFSEDSIATWPDKTFKYDILLDYTPRIDDITCDCFQNIVIENHKVKSLTTWDFLIDKNKLLIYEPIQPGEYCSKKILYTLKRRKMN